MDQLGLTLRDMDNRLASRQGDRSVPAAFGSDFVRQQLVALDALAVFRDCVASAAVIGVLWHAAGAADGCSDRGGSSNCAENMDSGAVDALTTVSTSLCAVLRRLLADYPLPIVGHAELRWSNQTGVGCSGSDGSCKSSAEGDPFLVPAVLPALHVLLRVASAVCQAHVHSAETGGPTASGFASTLSLHLGALLARGGAGHLSMLSWVVTGLPFEVVGYLVALPGLHGTLVQLADEVGAHATSQGFACPTVVLALLSKQARLP